MLQRNRVVQILVRDTYFTMTRSSTGYWCSSANARFYVNDNPFKIVQKVSMFCLHKMHTLQLLLNSQLRNKKINEKIKKLTRNRRCHLIEIIII